MTVMPEHRDLHVIDVDSDLDAYDEDDVPAGDEELRWTDGETDSELESLRDAFVEAFNSRNLEDLLSNVDADVEVPDVAGEDGMQVLADEIEAIWHNAPAMVLTRAFLDGQPCAMAWLPDEQDCWARRALVCFSHEGDVLTMVAVPDDQNAIERAVAEAPDDDELDEWSDWSEWEQGEETHLHSRQQ